MVLLNASQLLSLKPTQAHIYELEKNQFQLLFESSSHYQRFSLCTKFGKPKIYKSISTAIEQLRELNILAFDVRLLTQDHNQEE